MTAIFKSKRAVVRVTIFSFLLLTSLLCLYSENADAHELRPVIVAASLEGSGAVELRVSLNLEAQIAGIGPGHSNSSQSDKAPLYDRLRATSPEVLSEAFIPTLPKLLEALHLSFDGKRVPLAFKDVEIPEVGELSLARTSTLILQGELPEGAKIMTWRADFSFGNNVIRVAQAGVSTPFFSEFLLAGKESGPISLEGVVAQEMLPSLIKYVAIGFEHIVPKGLDHILFVVGLFLLSARLRPLLWQVTSFTLAHSVTLALGIYGIVSVPATIVEPLIAASIAFVAIENLFTDRLHRWRPAVVFAFGLLHGLGFAGVLMEIGLPRDQFISGLIGFNIGVELGQLAILAVCMLAVGLWMRHRSWYRPAITMPASVAIALIATFWFFERLA